MQHENPESNVFGKPRTQSAINTSAFRPSLAEMATAYTDKPIHYAFIPGRFDYRIGRDDRLRNHRRDVPSILLDEAVLLSGFADGENDAIDNREALLNEIQKGVETARREHDVVAQEIKPHLAWGQTTFSDIFVRDSILPHQQVLRGSRRPDDDRFLEFTYHDERDDELESRQTYRKHGLTQALKHCKEVQLLARFEQAIGSQDESTKIQTLKAIARSESEKADREQGGIVPAITEAHNTLEAGSKKDVAPVDKERLLNSALDLSLKAMDDLPEDDTLNLAAAYLTAAQAMHDLAISPGMFEQHMPEADAKEFRIRALEFVCDWTGQATDTFLQAFDMPIGTIDPTNVDAIQAFVNRAELYASYINQAFWFKGVYANEYKEALNTLEPTRVPRHIGRIAVIRALRPHDAAVINAQ